MLSVCFQLAAFERLEFLCYLNTIDRKTRKGGKADTFLPTNDPKCWSSHIFIFLCSAESFRTALYTVFSREKRRKGNIHWSKEIPNPSFSFSLFSSATPSHPSQLLNAFCWKSYPRTMISRTEMPKRLVKQTTQLPKHTIWIFRDLWQC